MPSFEKNTARNTAEAPKEKPARTTRAARPEGRLPKVMIHPDVDVTESEQRTAEQIREQIAQIGKSESINTAETAIKQAKKFFEGYGGPKGEYHEQEEILSELQGARDALEDERAETLSREGKRNQELLEKNAKLHAEIVKLIGIAEGDMFTSSTKYAEMEEAKTAGERKQNRKESAKTLETYWAEKQTAYRAAQKQTAKFAKQIKTVLGVEPEEITTMGTWARLKLGAKDLLNGGLVAKWRDALQKEDALSSELSPLGGLRHVSEMPSEETVARTKRARAEKAEAAPSDMFNQQYPEQSGEIDIKQPADAKRRMQQEAEEETADFAKEKIVIEKSRKGTLEEMGLDEEPVTQRMNTKAPIRRNAPPPPRAIVEAGRKAEELNRERNQKNFAPPEAVLKAGREAQEENRQRHERMLMTVEKAAGVIPGYASILWKFANDQLKGHKAAEQMLNEEYPEDLNNNPATKYVFVVARYVEALRGKDKKQIAEAKSAFNAMNAVLGIDADDQRLPPEVIPPKNPSLDVLKGTKSRQANVQKINARSRF